MGFQIGYFGFLSTRHLHYVELFVFLFIEKVLPAIEVKVVLGTSHFSISWSSGCTFTPSSASPSRIVEINSNNSKADQFIKWNDQNLDFFSRFLEFNFAAWLGIEMGDVHMDTFVNSLAEKESTPPPLPPPPPPEANGDNPNHVPELPPRGAQATPPEVPPTYSTLSKTEVDRSWSTGTQCGFGFLFFLAQVFLFGSLGLVLFWVFQYRGQIAWQDDISKEFNLHPVLMVGGFVFLLGQAILVYRGCRCCRKIYNKLWHTILHLLVMPAAAIAMVAVFDFHNLSKPAIPDLYSLHSWMGLGTLGLFGLQFIVGFFSFLVLLCCEKATARFRAALLPLHVHFGLATFLLGVATCVTGLTEKAIFSLKESYSQFIPEGIVINVLGLTIIMAGILVTLVVRTRRFQQETVMVINERLWLDKSNDWDIDYALLIANERHRETTLWIIRKGPRAFV